MAEMLLGAAIKHTVSVKTFEWLSDGNSNLLMLRQRLSLNVHTLSESVLSSTLLR